MGDRTGNRGGGGVPAAAAAIMMAAMAAFAVPAAAETRWQPAAGGSVAILPPPQNATAIVGASLYCAEQHWHLLFRTKRGSVPAGWQGSAQLTIDRTAFEAVAGESGGALLVAVSEDLLQALRAGLAMTFATDIANAGFSLRGSLVAIDAIGPLCSPVDMSAYTPVALSEDGSDVDIARGLLAEEARLFRAATGRQPSFAAARLDFDGGRTLLFSSICGPGSYYGLSGCSLFGHASDAAASDWREVYHTEGLSLYTDPSSGNDGWPNLVTLPLHGKAADHWQWNGSSFEPVAEPADEDWIEISQGDSEDGQP